MAALQAFLERRAPGRDSLSTARHEADAPEFLCGVKDGVATGAPIAAIIRNGDTRSKDYGEFADVPRPGHADYPAEVKFGGYQDKAGGGHFSGRLTAPLCIAGGIALQLLEVRGLPAGVGDPIFCGLENLIAQAVFGIPAVKGIEFGEGFAAADLKGSGNNDPYGVEDGRIVPLSNHAGGILGGISTGAPIVFRVAFKPTPSIAKEQDSVDLAKRVPVKLRVKGRHDPCVALRAVPCVEAAAAIAVYDALLES
jgi:chorismate synthase